MLEIAGSFHVDGTAILEMLAGVACVSLELSPKLWNQVGNEPTYVCQC